MLFNMVLIKQSFRSRVQALHILFTLFLAFRFLLILQCLFKNCLLQNVHNFLLSFSLLLIDMLVIIVIFRNSEHFGFAGEQIETEERLNILWRTLKNTCSYIVHFRCTKVKLPSGTQSWTSKNPQCTCLPSHQEWSWGKQSGERLDLLWMLQK